MRFAILTTGSRGDVQPYVALGVGLRARGHSVVMATHSDFETLVAGHGLDFYPVQASSRDWHASKTGDRMLASAGKPLAFLRAFAALRIPWIRQLMDAGRRICRDADLLVATNTEYLVAQSVAERFHLPLCWTSLQPTAPTRAVACSLFPEAPFWLPRGLFNLATHLVTAFTLWQSMRTALNQARHQVLGLGPLPPWGPIHSFFCPPFSIDAYSPLVVPRAEDWPATHHVTGYWFLDDGARWRPPAALSAFLAAGPPPVFVGFGSMHNRDKDSVTELVCKALDAAGQRGILQTGWDGLQTVAPTSRLFSLGDAPHDWLFPRMAAVVHHGGAGTTACGLRAGVPAVVVPFMADQPFWGRRVMELGVGPPPIPRHQLTAERLAERIHRAVTDDGIRQRAADFGEQIRHEDGVGNAARMIEEYARTTPRCPTKPPAPIRRLYPIHSTELAASCTP